MKCDRCQAPAVVHEVLIRNGVKHEVHLCEACAQAQGLATPGQQPIDQLLTQFVVATGPGGAPQAPARRCPDCGMRLAEFRQKGLLGCPRCYEAFWKELEGVVKRAQCGATHHAGKAPRRGGDSVDRQLLIGRLVKDLEDAVEAEQFERAAAIRDRLRGLESGGTEA